MCVCVCVYVCAQTFLFAALRTVVGKTSRAIATRSFSPLARAFAFFVTAAVVCLARVRH